MATSTQQNILETVASQIAALGLTDTTGGLLGADRVLVRWGIDVVANKLPAIFVCPAGAQSLAGGTNERDDIGYPVAIYCVDRLNLADHRTMDKALYWRERIRKKFIHQRLSTYAYHCLFEPSPVIDERLVAQYEILVEPIFFRFISREARG